MMNQMISRSHVRHGSEIIRYNADSAPIGATNHTAGVLNVRGKFGSRSRNTSTPIETMTNASNVPIETRLPASRTVKIAAKMATTIPVSIVVIQGVQNFGCTRLTNSGSKPSSAIVQKIRDWPRSITRMTELRPAMAPSLISGAIQPTPAWSAATAIGSGTSNCRYGTIPVAMADTAIYRTVQINNEPMMPIGISRWGFFASCAAVLTASNPMYAKNTIPAPCITPLQPKCPRTPVLSGMNGCQLAELTA